MLNLADKEGFIKYLIVNLRAGNSLATSTQSPWELFPDQSASGGQQVREHSPSGSESLKSAMRNVFKVKVAPFKRCWLLTLIYTQTTQMCNKPAPYGEDR